MSEINSELIHRGFWIDWSKGRVLGATWTTDSAVGNIVIALIAVLISFATSHLWNIILFVVHQSRATRSDQGMVFQQQQVIIRTLPIPFLLFADTTKIVWAWRKILPTRSLLQILATGLMALLFGHIAIVAGVFSSYMVRTSDIHVLVSDVQCAVNIDCKYLSKHGSDWVATTIRASQSYADYCYDVATEPSVCNVFATARVPMTQTNVTCPFNSPELCVGTSPTSIVFDSGLIDSNSILGINAPPADRIFFRKRTTYTPIQVQGHYSVLNRSQAAAFLGQRNVLTEEQIYSFNYGQTEHTAVLPGVNSTTYWPTSLSNFLVSYTASSDVSYANHTSDTNFVANPELRRSDADTALIFIYSNNIQSAVPIDDPVFASHQPLYCDSDTLHNCSTVPDPSLSVTLFSADHPAGVVSALSQYQACLSDHSGRPAECTDLTSLLLDRDTDLLPSANQAQSVVLRWLSSLTYLYDLDYIQNIDNDASALRVSRHTEGGFQLGLPHDQWVTEAFRWESTLWAMLQTATAYRTVGFGGKSAGYISPQTEAEFGFCRSQVVTKPGGFANINVFGLSLTIALSLIVIFTDIFALKLATLLSRTGVLSHLRVQQWIRDGALQLHRQTHPVGAIDGQWERLNREVPVLHQKKDLFDVTTADTHAVPWNVNLPIDRSSTNATQERRLGGLLARALSRMSALIWPRAALSRVDPDDSNVVFSNTLEEKRSNSTTTTAVHDQTPVPEPVDFTSSTGFSYSTRFNT